ncbi:MAG: hypothetical protein ABIP77_08095 [Candidatus Limnocylindrales bacterium]
MTRLVGPNPPGAGDPYGVGPVGTWLAPTLSILGLLLVATVTLNLANGDLPFGLGAGGGDGGAPARTPTPSNIVEVPEGAAFDGAIVYAKDGNIWIQDRNEARQLTNSGNDAMPSWSGDGQWVYFIQTTRMEGSWPVKGITEAYALDVPMLMRVREDGSGSAGVVLDGRITSGTDTYAYWIRQPEISPDGRTIAVISDAPDPDVRTPILQFLDPATGSLTDPQLETDGVLGHQDPAWSPDGTALLYVRNDRDGSRGAPRIMRYDVATGMGLPLTSGGYLYPSFSPDGAYVAATRTSTLGTDVVVLDGTTGEELLRVTDDGASWAPAWSPAGNGITFLHLDGQTVDLRLARLEGGAPAWAITETIDLTVVSGLDPASRPGWFIPADQLPATPAPTTVPASTTPSPAPPRPSASP